MKKANYLSSRQWSLPATKLPDPTCSQKPKSAAFGSGLQEQPDGRPISVGELSGLEWR